MANKQTPTHIGLVIGSGIPTNKHPVELRETQAMWISQNGVKYSKATGKRAGTKNDYSSYVLLLGSVKPIGDIL